MKTRQTDTAQNIFQLMKKHWIFKSYMKLPLWGKIAAPFIALFLISALFNMMKLAIGLAVLGGIAYVVISLFNRSHTPKL